MTLTITNEECSIDDLSFRSALQELVTYPQSIFISFFLFSFEKFSLSVFFSQSNYQVSLSTLMHYDSFDLDKTHHVSQGNSQSHGKKRHL